MKPTSRIGLASLFLVGLIVSMFGCTNVDQTMVPVTSFQSTVLFVDLSNTGTNMAIAYDAVSAGTLNYGGHSSAYVSIPSGSRNMRFTYGSAIDTLHQSYTSEYQYTYFSIYEPANGDAARRYWLLGQTYTVGAAAPKDSALVRFVNVSSDTAAAFSSGLDFTFGSNAPGAVTFPGYTNYYKVRAGNSSYTVVADASGDTLMNNAALNGLQSTGRYSVVIYGNHASLQAMVLQEH